MILIFHRVNKIYFFYFYKIIGLIRFLYIYNNINIGLIIMCELLNLLYIYIKLYKYAHFYEYI